MLSIYFINTVESLGQATLLTKDVFKTIFKGDLSRKEVLRQAYHQANKSLFFLTVTMGFTGAIMITQACLQARQMVGDLASIGPGFLDLLINEFAPTIGAVIIATRVGAGIAAELGTMAITEQLDALKISGTDPIRFLIAPRVLAGMFMMPLMAIWGGAIAHLIAGLVAHHTFHVAYDQFFSFYLADLHGVITGLIKASCHGAAMTTISSFYGIKAYGGSSGVGNATTKAVIGSILAILVLDFLIGGISYLLE